MAVRAQGTESIKFRIERLSWVVAAFYIVLVARLVYLQAIKGQFYSSRARAMREKQLTQTADRGAILDRAGRPLALTTRTSMLICNQNQVKDARATAEVLAKVLGTSPDLLLPYLAKPANVKGNAALILKYEVTPQVISRYRDARITPAGKRALEGIDFKTKPIRYNSAGRDAVHVVGLVKLDRQERPIGATGLEYALEKVLRGRDGKLNAEVDAHRRVIPHTMVQKCPKADGQSAQLTLDSNIQHMAETALAECCAKHKPVGATAIVIDPATGDVLAMVSYPSFDPIKREELKVKDSQAMRNYALTLFEPGSTMKIITAAAALQEGIITPATSFYCSGHMSIGRRTVSCASHGGSSAHGTETIREVIEHSCNVASAQIGMKVGMERLRPYLENFGLLDQTGVGLPMDPRGKLGFGADALETGDTKSSRVAFGQSVVVTPLGMAMAYGAIANHGILMRPRLVSAFQNSTGKVVRRFPSQQVRQVLKPELADYLVSLLEGVVTGGTGKAAAVPGYTVAGKTGTAQKVPKGQKVYARGKYVASFIGFLPARNPKALIYVVVDEPHGDYYGAQVAAPVFQTIGQQLMWYWKVPPDAPENLNNQKARLAKTD